MLYLSPVSFRRSPKALVHPRLSGKSGFGVVAMPSFDIVSRTEHAEVDNAIHGVMREIETRFDFKGSHCTIERTDDTIVLRADDDLKLRQMQELLKGYLARRKVAGGAFDFQKAEAAAGNTLKQTVLIKQGIDRELAQQIVKAIKEAKLKVQAAIQGSELRVSSKKRDDLQEAIALVKGLGLQQPLQYVNFRD